MDNNFVDVVQGVIEDAIPKNKDRSSLVDYLFKYRFGNKLPRGRSFDRVRMLEKSAEFGSFIEELGDHGFFSNNESVVSPYLKMQWAMLTLAQMKGVCCYNLAALKDVINKLEGAAPPSVDLIKYNIPFKGSGSFAGYKHHHVPLLPNSYLSMIGKANKDGSLINETALLEAINLKEGKFDLNSVEEEISQRGARKGGRMTGHWLISRQEVGANIYLGVFPHSQGKHDDVWIKKCLFESERLLSKFGFANVPG
ncbi:hypothetical protein A11A3_12988 [Alcanivorax hongdengensis A-11-3]|uniref:Uncharacterized protein n=1 Tax=Alcanivorax hongdengensis A-11-3 TaxID=1177179 RepID=L0WCS3_9GAMM|nr:hypothetical protein [Alcanivorax hongdengensis]EKF73545.1 hypothetical protein A11A3_12988 [Alcanivorax hongdengensis A-11-3]